MRMSRLSRLKSGLSPARWTAPLMLGIGLFVGFPSVSAHADLATFLSGINRGGERWRMHMTRSPAGSLHEVEMVFSDPRITGALGDGAGIDMPDGGKVSLTAEQKQPDPRTDEDRVNRRDKKGRIIAVAPMTPPKDFTAGSILQRTSSLTEPLFDTEERMAFAKPKIIGKEIQIATAFYKKKAPKIDPGMSPMLASLVTNQGADVLATAYGPAEPDYARQSPFDSILREDKTGGRFIPDISPEDHAWAANPLPAGVFSEAEQKCLTSGIYFESRGESLKGQAAVAQVILNRVRNPAYPDTICAVVYQNKGWFNRCQFSFACDGIPDIVWSRANWQTAKEIALAVTAGKIWFPEVGSATHYHATYVKPDWGPTMKRVSRIGKHIFYRTYGGGWS
ncbi:spore germination cell wall hydrolase CwlJ-like protein [Rhizobium herbae]|uniref:Spore germination cell wall hydrolase CwlJ-like protein n=2 Tax=Rhizobium herbae TaxID=508661 RepID=A0ABS4END6_9HYPH|nr:spore germination cell wall hydrolase CwlJ-like protein [Rhizobium herbae]